MAEYITTNIEQQLSQLNLNQQSISSTSSSSLEMSMASLQQQPAITWRQTVDLDLRIHLADKLFDALPIPQSHQERCQFEEYAKKLENDAFQAANTRAEYYHLITVNIYELQKQRYTKEQSWRESLAVELRKHIVNKLIQTIIPGCDLETIDEQNSMRNLLDYAQKVECEIFLMATSRSGYYKLIGEKIYNIQQGIDEELSDDCC